MKKIIINNINYSNLCIHVDVEISGNMESLIVNLNDMCIPYLTTDRIDAVVVGFLYFAMKQGYDFESTLPMTRDLWYNIVYHFIPGLAMGNPHLHKPSIKCPLVDALPTSTKKYNATGISCGVDSLYTIATNISKDIPIENRLNALCFFNVGAAMKGDGELRTSLIQGRLNHAQSFATEYDFPFFFLESNIHLLIDKYGGYSHVDNNGYMALFCILFIQKGIKQYHYSSGYSILDFCINNPDNKELDSEHYDILTFGLITVPGTNWYSEGADKSRQDKVKALIKWPPSFKYLNVCVDEPDNCGVCFKCIRTLLSIDAVGNIDDYKEVFDVEFYKKNRKSYLRRLYIAAALKHDFFMSEIYPYFKEKMTISFKLWCIWTFIKNKITHNREIV